MFFAPGLSKTNFEKCRESRSGVTLSNLNSNDENALLFVHSNLVVNNGRVRVDTMVSP